jgi:hypothetical protein
MTPEQLAAIEALRADRSGAPPPAPAQLTDAQRAAVEALRAERPRDGALQQAADLGLRQFLGQGAAMGWGDEIIAGARRAGEGVASAFTGQQPRTYTDLLAEERDINRRTERDNPVAAPAAQVAGAVGGALAGGLAARGAMAAGNVVGRGLTAAGNLVGRVMPAGRWAGAAARGGAAGAAGGAVQGAGEAEGGLVETAQGAAGGAALGAAVGAPLGMASTAVGGAVRGMFGPADEQAALIAQRSMARDGTTPTGVVTEYERAVQAATRLGATPPPMSVADVTAPGLRGDNNLSAQLNSGLNRPISEAGAPARDALAGRMDDQAGRVRELFARAIDTTGGTPAEAMRASRAAQQAAGAHFDAARAIGPVNDPDILAILPRLPPEVMESARNIGRLQGHDPASLMRDGALTRPPEMRDLITIHRAMRDRIDSLFRSGDSEQAIELRGAMRALVARMDALSPDYATGRRLHADEARVQRAMEAGGRAFNGSPDELDFYVRDLSDPERDAFVRGAAGALSRRLGDVREGNRATRVGLTDNDQQVLRTVLQARFRDAPDVDVDQRLGDLVAVLRQEERIANSSAAALSNSRTALNNAASDDRRMGDPVFSALVAPGGVAGLTGAGLGVGAGYLTGSPEIGAAAAAGLGGGGFWARQLAARRAAEVDGNVVRLLGATDVGGVRLRADELTRLLRQRQEAVAGMGTGPVASAALGYSAAPVGAGLMEMMGGEPQPPPPGGLYGAMGR